MKRQSPGSCLPSIHQVSLPPRVTVPGRSDTRQRYFHIKNHLTLTSALAIPPLAASTCSPYRIRIRLDLHRLFSAWPGCFGCPYARPGDGDPAARLRFDSASQTPSVATSCSNSCRRGPHSLFPRIVNDSLCRQYATTRTKGQTASPWHSAAASLLRHTIAVRSMRSNPIPRLSRWSPLNAENLNYGNATVTHRSARLTRTVCIDASASGN